MIALIQILERGNNYLVYSLKGTELQETTVCHAEENENINQISEQIFKNKKTSCNFAFSLSPIKQLSFSIYDDQKVSLTGIIDSPDFAKLFKEVFMRTLIIKLKDLIKSSLNIKFYRIFKGDPTQKEIDYLKQFYDKYLLDFYDIQNTLFQFSSEQIPKSSIIEVNNSKPKPVRNDI